MKKIIQIFEVLKTRKFLILIIFLLLGIGGYFLFSHSDFGGYFAFNRKQKSLLEQIEKEKEKYQNDVFGGLTPLETYNLFLEALKKSDIELAVKYFPLDLQSKYLELFNQIKKSGQWEKMIKDLEKSENQIGEYVTSDWYNIKIKNDKNEVVTTVVLKIIKDFDNRPVTSLWKIVEF
ncbi:MAG TPA: hypothetical protein PK119_01670 [Candidatus Paceibacterota bacterium]|nr:hypothetical protein [Candidatus Paceibacterota bacterium]